MYEAGFSNMTDLSVKTNKKHFYLNVVEKLEVAGFTGSPADSLGQLQRASASLGPVVTRHGVRGPALFGEPTHKVNLCLSVGPDGSPGKIISATWLEFFFFFLKKRNCISLEDVKCHHHWNTKQVGDFNLLPEVAQATTFNEAQVLQQEEKESQQPLVVAILPKIFHSFISSQVKPTGPNFACMHNLQRNGLLINWLHGVSRYGKKNPYTIPSLGFINSAGTATNQWVGRWTDWQSPTGQDLQ